MTLVFSLVTFSGGDAGKFAQFLAETSEKTVVTLEAGVPIKPFKFYYDPKNGLSNAVKMHTGQASKAGFAFYRPGWPTYKVRPPVRIINFEGTNGVLTCQPWPTKSLSEFDSSKLKIYRLSELGSEFFGKRIDIHWFYSDMIVGIGNKGTDTVDLFHKISDAVGAKFSFSKDVINLAFDSKEFRRRTYDWVTESRANSTNRSGSGLEVADLDLFRESLDLMSDAALLEAFSAGKKEIKIQVKPKTRLMGFVERRLTAYAGRKDIANANDPGMIPPAEMVGMVDWERPVYVTFTPGNFRASFYAMIKGEKGAVQF